MQMDSSKSESCFHGISYRELSTFRVRKRPFIDELASEFNEVCAVAIEHDAEPSPPLAISFCKANKNSHVFAVSDELGYVSLFDSNRKISPAAAHQENTEKARISEWVAHENAIFDVCWIKDDSHILTASGDQTIKVWDAQEKKCTGVLILHTGSVKCLSSHPTNSDLFVSGSRDGSFAIWDLRCKINSRSRSDEVCLPPTTLVKGAHPSSQARRGRRGKAAVASITSVLYLKDGISIATAGAADSVVKFWDTRNLKSHVTQACPQPEAASKKGISSLSQDSRGVFLTASCMDNRVYLYNILQLDKGPMHTFSGCQIESFYVKSAISPDADYILSGSSNGNSHIWKVNKPQEEPIILKNHLGEVTAVDWCPSEIGKMATTADDFTVRIWNIQANHCSSSRSPSSIRTSTESRKLLMNEKEEPGSSNSSDEPLYHIQINPPSTPETHKKKLFSISDSNETTLEKTPEALMKNSPSSVLSPPSSLKRKTIKDYFLAAP
ncbi:hypothetical protein F3Y22_tig00110940pilonHSYRG00421 [Hibiscus syriacus]|uniref:Uncharacterized protein n=1 Tax=Hibiscus syriacus TaxID=106335 RepID=A0A6A2ZD68_HIBSY|nr:denticleless protein homolog [Hibiscus syriacus]KAE8689349.1 hypothetical protein F3Y22_tig00110940pilonHSYRG00421 [Hibiscus syriacus]